MFCCLKGCLNGVLTTPNMPVRPRENPIHLDSTHMGLFENNIFHI